VIASPFSSVNAPIRYRPTDQSSCRYYIDAMVPGSYSAAGSALASVTNMVSGNVASEASLRPSVVTLSNGRRAFQGNGSTQRILSSEPAVLSCFSGEDAQFTVIFAVELSVLDASGLWLGLGNSAAATGYYEFGQSTSGSGIWWMSKVPDGGSGGNCGSIASTRSGPTVLAWQCTGTTCLLYINGVLNRTQNSFNFTTTTLDRFALFARPASTIANFGSAKLVSAQIYSGVLGATAFATAQAWAMRRCGALP
jgi:hypothetical protein